MSIFRCNKCGYIKEVPEKHIGRVAKCPKCNSDAKVVDTITFTQKIISTYIQKQNQITTYKANMQKAKEYIAIQKERYQNEISKLQQNIEKLKNQNSSLNSKYSKSLNQSKKDQSKIEALEENIKKLQEEIANSTNGIENISHDQEYNPKDDYQPIVNWFSKSNIIATIDRDAVDTRGFFDEVAITLGNNFDVLKSVLEQMRYIQRKGYDTVKISLDEKSKDEISIINSFCKEIYDYSFASRYHHDKKKNAIYLEIQKATKITNFFDGIWMEWYVYMMLLDRFEKQDIPYTLIKGLKITHNNREKNELDIFFIIGDIPVCIECKSGEFRRDIDKYLKLRKRLKLDKKHFIICAIGLDNIQTDGLTNTFDITFTNQNNLLQYIDTIVMEAKENEDKISKIKDDFMMEDDFMMDDENLSSTKEQYNIDNSQVQTKTTSKKSSFLGGIISPFKR
jgi:hypothetical protein